MDTTNLQVLREAFGRVVYTHKTHEKAADIETRNGHYLKWANLVLITLTSGSIIADLVSYCPVLGLVIPFFALITLAVTVFQLSFNPDQNAASHRQVAKELLYIREKYVNLIADVKNKAITDKEITDRRDALTRETTYIYKFAPQTTYKAYKEAQKSLKVDEDLTFSDEEINHFLPKDLHV